MYDLSDGDMATLSYSGRRVTASPRFSCFNGESRAGASICIDTAKGATALLLSGELIDELIVGSGPFVMNSPLEIRQAMADYRNGKMGHLP